MTAPPRRSSDDLRVAIIADLAGEQWRSMDLVADMLVECLNREPQPALTATLVRPVMPSRRSGLGRYINRYWDYPRWLRKNAREFDVCHVVDHSYAHVVHALPQTATIVTCHDTDAFLPLVSPGVSSSRLPVFVVERILSGMRKAQWVACPSAATQDELVKWSLIDPERIVVVPNGVHPAFTPHPDAAADATVAHMVGGAADSIDLLHVGTCIPRKRIDRLLEVLAAVRQREPRVRLVKAGGRFTPEQQALSEQLGVEAHVVHLPYLEPGQLAAVYRRAALVIAPSDREGFGLPVAEAMACGTSVIATDLPVFREVGGPTVRYCQADNIDQWATQVLEALEAARSQDARLEQRTRNVASASRYSWAAYAEQMAGIYARPVPEAS